MLLMNGCLDTELVSTHQRSRSFIFLFNHDKNIERVAEKQTNKQNSPFSRVSMEIYVNSMNAY